MNFPELTLYSAEANLLTQEVTITDTPFPINTLDDGSYELPLMGNQILTQDDLAHVLPLAMNSMSTEDSQLSCSYLTDRTDGDLIRYEIKVFIACNADDQLERVREELIDLKTHEKQLSDMLKKLTPAGANDAQ